MARPKPEPVLVKERPEAIPPIVDGFPTCWLCACPDTRDVVEGSGKEKTVVTRYVKDSTKCTVIKPDEGKVYGSIHVCKNCLDQIGGLTESSAAKVSFAKFHKAWSDHDKFHPHPVKVLPNGTIDKMKSQGKLVEVPTKKITTRKPKASNLSQKKPEKRKVSR